jgi:hypothetical protein
MGLKGTFKKEPALCDITHLVRAIMTLAVRLRAGVGARGLVPDWRGCAAIEVSRMKRFLSAVIGLIACLIAMTGAAGAAGQAPAAVVEDVQGKVTGAEFMDYVVPGQVIKLGAGGRIVLGYMKSCWHEVIFGIGTVIVGTEQSAVHLAEFKADHVPCDASQAARIGKETGESAATVVRSLRDDGPPPLVLHGLTPMVGITERGKLVIERVDVKGERYEVDLTSAPLVHGKFYDLARSNIALKAGGTYAMTLKSRRVAFVVDTRATPGAGPVIGRLVTLQ